MNLAEKLINLLNADGVEELWNLNCQLMAEYGFDKLNYGYTRYRTEKSLGDPDDFVLMTNLPKDYIKVFMGEGLYVHAPMVRWSLANEGCRSWSFIDDLVATGKLTDNERKVLNFNASHGIYAGYSISFKSVSPRTRGAIALAARSEMSQQQVNDIWDEHGKDIFVLNTLTHLRILSLPYTTAGRSLTKRQREVLEWVSDGKTIQDIAVLLELTSATVEKHLRLARESLNVETTAQAVLKAASQNQMFMMDTK